jgi:hypothetical protein
MTGYSLGPNAIDDATGFKVKLSSLRRQWDGAMVVNPDRRNPQDFVRGVPDRSDLPFARPESPDVFITPGVNDVRPQDL